MAVFFPHLSDKDGQPTGLQPGDSLTALLRDGRCEIIMARGASERLYFSLGSQTREDKRVLPFDAPNGVYELMVVMSCLTGMRFVLEQETETRVRYRFVGVGA